MLSSLIAISVVVWHSFKAAASVLLHVIEGQMPAEAMLHLQWCPCPSDVCAVQPALSYTAPELVKGAQHSHGALFSAADVFSLGMCNLAVGYDCMIGSPLLKSHVAQFLNQCKQLEAQADARFLYSLLLKLMWQPQLHLTAAVAAAPAPAMHIVLCL